MSLIQLALANLKSKPLSAGLNITLLGLATASIVILLLLSKQLLGTLERDARGIDLVLGAKGSPIQLVLSSVYHADIPTGNISLEAAQQWANHRDVASAIPLALGDSYRGFRIVGTTTDYAHWYDAKLTTGQFWQRPFEAVVGSKVAAETGAKVASQFAGAHGMSSLGDVHDEQHYTVVGILEPTGTVLDRLILTAPESVWLSHGEHDHPHHEEAEHEPQGQHMGQYAGEHAEDEEHSDHSAEEHSTHDEHSNDPHHHDAEHTEHEHEHEHEHEKREHDEHAAHEEHEEHQHDDREITAMLIKYASPLAAASLPRTINAQSELQAAAPAFELARLLKLVGLGLDGLKAFALILMVTAAFSLFSALYAALNERRGELALMRCLGATRGQVMLSLLIEGLMLSLLGTLLGLGLGHVAVELVANYLPNAQDITVTGWIWLPEEILLCVSLLGVGILAAALPAWQAYRSDVSNVLSQHH